MSNAFMMFYPGDYLRDTGHLSTEEHGAYLLLLWHAWTQNGILPMDDELLRRITRMAPKAWAKSRAIIMAFFTRHDDGWHQKRMDRELAKARVMVAKKREAVERTQQWRAANPRQRPNGHGPPDDPHVMHNVMYNEDITDAQQGHNVMSPLPQPVPEPVLEPVREEESKRLKNLSFFSGTRASETPPDALDAVLSEAGVEQPEPGNLEKNVGAEVVQMHVRRIAKAMEMRIPYGEVRSVEAQLDAIKAQPGAVGAEQTMGLKWRPADPVRSPAEQYAELLGLTLPEAEARLRGPPFANSEFDRMVKNFRRPPHIPQFTPPPDAPAN